MPTLAEEALWQAVKDKNFAAVQSTIASNPDEDLVNTLHVSNGRSLVMHMADPTSYRNFAASSLC